MDLQHSSQQPVSVIYHRSVTRYRSFTIATHVSLAHIFNTVTPLTQLRGYSFPHNMHVYYAYLIMGGYLLTTQLWKVIVCSAVIIFAYSPRINCTAGIYIRASVDALSRDGTDMRGDAQNPKSFQAPRM